MAAMLKGSTAANATDARAHCDATGDGRDAPGNGSGSEAAVADLRQVVQRLQGQVHFQQTTIAALNFELARLKRWRFGQSSEAMEGSTQAVLFDQIVADTALEDRAGEEAAKPPAAAPIQPKRQAVRQALPASLPRVDYHHELANKVCECGQPLKRIGEEVSEQLDCEPIRFTVLRHIRGKYACACCQTIRCAPMPAQVIDKGIATPGLLAQIIIAKHDVFFTV